jgi:hypothetical protein
MKHDADRSPPPPRCASCGGSTDPSDAFLSSRGSVCAACHRRDAQTVRARDRRTSTSSDARMNGVFALGAASMLAVVAFFRPDGMADGRVFGICGLSLVALVVCALRSWRSGADAPHGRVSRAVVVASVLLGAISAWAIVQRLG